MSAATADLVLSPDELRTLTGYQRPSRQLQTLRLMGFSRARINRAGALILERAHYTAVCAGVPAAASDTEDKPVRVRTDHLRARRR